MKVVSDCRTPKYEISNVVFTIWNNIFRKLGKTRASRKSRKILQQSRKALKTTADIMKLSAQESGPPCHRRRW